MSRASSGSRAAPPAPPPSPSPATRSSPASTRRSSGCWPASREISADFALRGHPGRMAHRLPGGAFSALVRAHRGPRRRAHRVVLWTGVQGTEEDAERSHPTECPVPIHGGAVEQPTASAGVRLVRRPTAGRARGPGLPDEAFRLLHRRTLQEGKRAPAGTGVPQGRGPGYRGSFGRSRQADR